MVTGHFASALQADTLCESPQRIEKLRLDERQRADNLEAELVKEKVRRFPLMKYREGTVRLEVHNKEERKYFSTAYTGARKTKESTHSDFHISQNRWKWRTLPRN